ncbi:MAG TPA: hypothetical protein VM054_05120 [bacterium]|nr:hypothetical protein [bacterium]
MATIQDDAIDRLDKTASAIHEAIISSLQGALKSASNLTAYVELCKHELELNKYLAVHR